MHYFYGHEDPVPGTCLYTNPGLMAPFKQFNVLSFWNSVQLQNQVKLEQKFSKTMQKGDGDQNLRRYFS